MSISRFNSPNFVSMPEPVKQVLLSGPSSLMYSNKPRALLESQSPSQIVGPTSVQPNSDKRTILKMIHDLPEENSPINETLRLLQEEFSLKRFRKNIRRGFFLQSRCKFSIFLKSFIFFQGMTIIKKGKMCDSPAGAEECCRREGTSSVT